MKTTACYSATGTPTWWRATKPSAFGFSRALATARFRYTAYDAAFGSEIDTLPGLSLNDEIAQSELKRFITEAIMVNPYIVELSNFLFTRTKSGMTVEFDCETVYGRVHYTWESKGVSV